MAINPVFGQAAQTQASLRSINSVQNTTISSKGSGAGGLQLTPVRVKKIILDDSDLNLFNRFGQWNSIGTIFYEDVTAPLLSADYILENSARPIFPNIKQYPLINEIVYLVSLPSLNTNLSSKANVNYYFPPLNIWNDQLHNAFPIDIDNSDLANIPTSKDYASSFQGKVKTPKNKISNIKLGSTFIENNSKNNHPLLPYEGDIIYEGRFGNSIRFGSTVKNANIRNYWSSTGENGDPLIIIRNGQGNYDNINPWEHVIEDINSDSSNIWLTSTQKLPIDIISNLKESYSSNTTSPPTDPKDYSQNQILLTSGRLVFNAKNDAIILGAQNTIHLSSNDSINLDSIKSITLSSPKVYLGSSTGTIDIDIQSAVLGEELNSLLSEIAQYLSTLNTAFSSATDSMGVPIASLLSAAAPPSLTLSQKIQKLVASKKLLSKIVKISK